MTINWVKKRYRAWCRLDELTLHGNYFDGFTGVYVIWHDGNPPWTVKVGQGVIKDRFQVHRQYQAVQYYASLGL